MAKKKVTAFECDNPRCGQIVLEEDGIAFGYHIGRVIQHAAWGGGAANRTFACSEECITPAIMSNFHREAGRDPLTGERLEDL